MTVAASIACACRMAAIGTVFAGADGLGGGGGGALAGGGGGGGAAACGGG